MNPLAKFGGRPGKIPRLVQLGQGGPAYRPGVVMKADQGIELLLAGWGIAQGAGNIRAVAGQIGLKPGIALRRGPDRARADPLAGGAPADGPGIAAGAGIGIGLKQSIAALPGAAFKPLDQGNPVRANPLWTTWTTIQGKIYGLVQTGHFGPGEAAAQHLPNSVENCLAVHRCCLRLQRGQANRHEAGQ